METSQISEKFSHLVMNHPCLGRAPHRGRLHLPVSPACNIKCRFCTRSFNRRENRPGVTRSVLPVAEAMEVVAQAIQLCPEISVVGIAGPGDSLATDHALDCFRRLREEYPDLIGCLSTNGLSLPQQARAIAAAGVHSVTVTVNAVDPAIQAQIIDWIALDGRRLSGAAAAAVLIDSQLTGIRLLSELNILVKINCVLIPSLNGAHIGEIARVTAAAGAAIINIIPLIPQGDFADWPAPDCDDLQQARSAAERFLPVFRHCRHCRADACGLLGRDVSAELYRDVSAENTFSHG
ncbi:MAG: radical SAM protein [Gracilibacteraceae bacterium]|nr:radical SAM protein [Gracilibacteraceae bacterium]